MVFVLQSGCFACFFLYVCVMMMTMMIDDELDDTLYFYRVCTYFSKA